MIAGLPPLSTSARATVAISTLERKESLGRTLNALRDVDLDSACEILIVDQSDLPFDAGVWKDAFGIPVRTIHHRDRGLGRSRNEVLRQCLGEVLICIDDDVIPDRDLVREHIQVYRDFPESLGVAGREVIPRERRPPVWRDRARRALVALLRPYLRASRYRDFLDADGSPVAIVTRSGLFLCEFAGSRPARVMTPRGCNMSFRTDALRAIGGFDDGCLGPRRDETDAALRLLSAFPDGSIWFNPRAGVLHRREPSGGCRETDRRLGHARALACELRFARRHLSPPGRAVFIARLALLNVIPLLRHPGLCRELLLQRSDQTPAMSGSTGQHGRR